MPAHAGQLELFENDLSTPGRLTFVQACNIFWELEGQFKPSASTYRFHLKNLCKYFDQRYFDSLRKHDFLEYIKHRRSQTVVFLGRVQPIKDSTINRERTALCRMYNAFKEWKKVGAVKNYDFSRFQLPPENPVFEVPRLSEKKYVRNVILTKRQFWKAVRKAHPETRKIIVVAILTLLRRKDLEVLSKSNVNAVLSQLEGEQSKTEEMFSLPMAYTVRMIANGSPYEFILDFTNHRRRMTALWKAVGLYFQLKDIRKSGATHMSAMGIDIVTIMKLLGHSTLNTTMIYIKPASLLAKKAIRKIDRELVGPVRKFLSGGVD